ncbi:hypothetical protein KKA00_01945, partial [bacterium]|nr:hypothetical protein [bacterium]
MNSKPTSIELETRRIFYNDGVIDLCVGVGLLLSSLALWLDLFLLKYLAGVSFIIIYFPLKKNVIYPRLGYFKFKKSYERRLKARFMIMVLVLSGLAMMVYLWDEGR